MWVWGHYDLLYKNMCKRNHGLNNVAFVVMLPHCNLFQTLEQHCCQGGLELGIYQS